MAHDPPKPGPAPEAKPEVVFLVAEGGNGKAVPLNVPIIVRELAAALGLKPFAVLGDLLKQNILVNVNQSVPETAAAKVCQQRGFVIVHQNGGAQ